MNSSKILFLILGIINLSHSYLPNNTELNNKNYTSGHHDVQNYDDIYYMDDDDGFDQPKNSSIGTLFLDVQLFRDENCTQYTGFHNTVIFNFPESCSCLNNNTKCWKDLLHSIYFTNFNWTADFKLLYPEFPVQGNLNISKCIIESQHTNQLCIPCQDLYLQYQVHFSREQCITIIIILVIIIIFVSALLLYGTYWFIFQCRNDRNQYTRIRSGQSEDADTRYRFYTTN